MKILLAIDGSSASMEAAKFVCRLPHREPWDVSVLTVVGLPDVPLTAATDLWYSKYVESEEESGVKSFQSIRQCFEGSDTRLQHLSKQGHAGHAIIAAAEEIKADLIVVGSRGHSKLDRILLGSVSDYVASHSPVSVLIVRPDAVPRAVGDHLKIVLAYDDSECSKKAIAQFKDKPWMRHAHVELLAVVPVPRIFHQGLMPIQFDPDEEVVREVTERAEAAALDLQNSHIETKVTIAEAEHIGDKIVSITDESQPDLVVMGSRGRSGISRALMGSVSQYVLRHSKRSIWLVRC